MVQELVIVRDGLLRMSGDVFTHTFPLTSTWPHLRSDVGLEEGEDKENCLHAPVLYSIIMLHNGTSSSYR